MHDRQAITLFAHRGDKLQAPENTIEAARLALEQGATGLEVDVRLCGSGELLLFHDKSLLRHFGKMKPISFTPYKDLKQYRYEQNGFSGDIGIQTLEAYLEEFKGTVPLILDIKSYYANNLKLVRTLANTLSDLKMIPQVWVSTFDPSILAMVKILNPEIRTGYLFRHFPTLSRYIDAVLLKSDAWHPHYSVITKSLMAHAKKLNKQLYVWTVNRMEVYNRLAEYNFDGIITDSLYRKEFSDKL